MNAPSVSVTPRSGGPLVFDVIVRGSLDESRHQVTITADEAERWAEIGAQLAACVEALMR
jgi:ribosomal protein S16